ncbi:MAG: SpoIIE family protein phosphatase [Prevotellaceae bacterium]|nr:SpoIIE family protein phosphatase [Candidatus Colivivens equi]
MKQLLDFKTIASVAFWTMLICGIAFTFGFGSTWYLANDEVTKEADEKVERDIRYVETYIDGQLQRIEDVGYSLASRLYGNTVRKKNGEAEVCIDSKQFTPLSATLYFENIEDIMKANPIVCGIAMCFEPNTHPHIPSKNGFAPYVNRLGGELQRLDLGNITNSRTWEWYVEPKKRMVGYWCKPFRDSSRGHVITCYNIPIKCDGKFYGVIAIDIDTEAFSKKCEEIAPYPNSVIAITDGDFNYIAHPDTSFILHNVAEMQDYSKIEHADQIKTKMLNGESGSFKIKQDNDENAYFYFAPLKRTGWIISVLCPEEEIFGGINNMKQEITFIAIISIILMVLCLLKLFHSMQKEMLQKSNIENELKVASDIQMGMLPKLYPAFPERSDLDVYGFQKPAKSVGGDIYDYFIRDDKFFFCVGDVSGKGIPASLIMSVIRALFRNVSNTTDDPSKIIESMNTTLSDGHYQGMFCTMFLGILNLKTGHLDYCNAGHNKPIMRRFPDTGEHYKVNFANVTTNIALGVIEDFEYVKDETELKPGEAIFLYTDGVTEAEDTHKQLFGDEAVLKALGDARKHVGTSAKAVIEDMYYILKLYTIGAEQNDDITMVIIEYKG